ncbi:hypothetical protein EJB05_18981, partial [Eragrostis curvula]
MRMNTMNSGSKLKAEAIIKGAQLEERTVESEADHEQEESSEVFGKKKKQRGEHQLKEGREEEKMQRGRMGSNRRKKNHGLVANT